MNWTRISERAFTNWLLLSVPDASKKVFKDQITLRQLPTRDLFGASDDPVACAQGPGDSVMIIEFVGRVGIDHDTRKYGLFRH